jgi:hypothetical protein
MTEVAAKRKAAAIEKRIPVREANAAPAGAMYTPAHE